jgi:ribosomal-protein-alanine N-acetyltransferase
VELISGRLRLRPFRDADVSEFMRFALDPAYLRYLGDRHPEPARFVANNVGIDGAWVIELDELVVGSIFVGEELACLLDPAVHGQGIAGEAARMVVDDAFTRRGYSEIVANADPDNVASVRALASLGFVPAGDDEYRLTRTAWGRSSR